MSRNGLCFRAIRDNRMTAALSQYPPAFLVKLFQQVRSLHWLHPLINIMRIKYAFVKENFKFRKNFGLSLFYVANASILLLKQPDVSQNLYKNGQIYQKVYLFANLPSLYFFVTISQSKIFVNLRS